MKDLAHFQSMAASMIAADAERDRMLRAMDDMWHNRWSLPPTVAGLKWIHKVVSSDPHDAVRAGTRVLSNVAPRVNVQPWGPAAGDHNRAERIERGLAWQFRQASRRRRASVLRDIVLSALLYDEVVAQVVYLPYQAASQLALENAAHSPRSEMADRFGPFAIIVRNPQQVHVRYSDWMPEAVLMKKVMPLQEAVDFWGKQARGLTQARPKTRRGRATRDQEFTHCSVYDYMDLEQRAVWAVPQSDGGLLADPTGEEGAGAVEILREEHDLGFLPWAARVGGTTLAEGGGQQRIPLLYSIFSSGQWETQNIVETLLASEVIAYAAAPRLKIEGPSDGVEVDYGEPGRPAYVPPGHKLDPLAPPGMDQGLAAIAQRVSERMGKSTVPRVLQNGDFPASTAYATLNLATQSAIKSLGPYKELAEEALEEIFALMLNWLQRGGQPLQALDTRRGHNQLIEVPAAQLADLSIEVELTADVPTDRMARINAASMAVRDLGYSRERALEQIGETDAREVMRQAMAEELEAVDLEIEKQRRLALAKDANALENRESADLPGSGDQGFNPAAGGTPPVVANPDAVAGANTKAKG